MKHQNFNLKSLAVNFLESGSIELRIQNDVMDYPMSFILLHEELPDFIACLKGETYRTFRDISYFLTVQSNVMHYVKLSSSYDGKGTYEEHYLYAPYSKMNSLLELIFNHSSNFVFSYEFELSGHELNHYCDISKPCYKWDFRNITTGKWAYPEGKTALNSTYLESTYIEKVDYSVEDSIIRMASNHPELLDRLQNLIRIARNSSSGIDNKITIQLSLDRIPHKDHPDDYYFSISNKDNKRVINGGIIFHSSSNEYSTHT